MTAKYTRAAGLMIAAASALLAGCTALPGLSGEDGGITAGLSLPTITPSHVIVTDQPPQVYTRLARQIYACWLSAEPALLPGQLFYAEAEPGDSGNARISLHTPGTDGHKGVRTYSIKMQRVSEGTRIETEPFHIDDAQQRDTMHRAIMAWAQGSTDCDAGKAPEPVVTAVAPAEETAAQAAGDKPAADKAAAAEELPPLPTRRPKGNRGSAKPTAPKAESAPEKPKATATARPASKPVAAAPAPKPEPEAEYVKVQEAPQPTVRDVSQPEPQKPQAAAKQDEPSRVISLRGARDGDAPATTASTSSPPAAALPAAGGSSANVRIHMPQAPIAVQPQGIPWPSETDEPATGEPAAKAATADKLPGEHMFLQSEPGFAGQ